MIEEAHFNTATFKSFLSLCYTVDAASVIAVTFAIMLVIGCWHSWLYGAMRLASIIMKIIYASAKITYR